MENLSTSVLKTLAKELTQLKTSPPEGIKINVNESNMLDIQAIIDGPEGTPYQEGKFPLKIVLPNQFPDVPPQCFFGVKIFHPNVGKNGEVCVNTLKKDWNRSFGLTHILLTIKCLLIDPNPESALNEEAGKFLLENYSEYERHARLWTKIHAKTADSSPANKENKLETSNKTVDKKK
ncbi:ubiquitin-conjugating enzyme E2 S, partial [Rozella allomycis CSF55]